MFLWKEGRKEGRLFLDSSFLQLLSISKFRESLCLVSAVASFIGFFGYKDMKVKIKSQLFTFLSFKMKPSLLLLGNPSGIISWGARRPCEQCSNLACGDIPSLRCGLP